MASGSNYYALLGIPRNADPVEIRSAYFEAARRFHPDTNPDADANERFLQVQEAFEILSNPEKRANYDAHLILKEEPPPSIKFNAIFSRSTLPRLDEPQLVYALLEMISVPDPAESDSTTPLNLCLVLDRSTSMQGARMDMVKANTIQMVRQMRPQDTISIVTFSDRAEVLVPSTRAADLSKIESRISMILPGGGTEIFHGLDAGINQLRRRVGANTISHLILMTDGRTYGDEEACIRLAEEVSEEGISISGLGIGHEWNDIFLDNLASAGGGNSMYISAPRDLHRYLETKLSNLEKIYAEHVILDVETGPDVELRYAFRLQPESGSLPTQKPIRLGSIVQSRSSNILLEFMVKRIPEDVDEVTLMRGRIKMDIPSREIPATQVPLFLTRPVSSGTEPEPPHPAVVQAMSRLTLYRMQEKARVEVNAGEINSATRHLQFLATHLLAQGERELAHTVLVEAEHIQQTEDFTREGNKRIKYGTRALLLPPGLEYKRS
jgi:Ca-activated chloride channel family protein